MISYFLMAVAAILVLASLLALRHCIVSALESDHKTIGTLKSFGTENKQVLSFVLLQYLMTAVFATSIGAGISVIIQKPVLYLFLSFSGLAPKLIIFPFLIAGVILGICFVTLITAWTSARRVYKVSPVRAISLGQAPVHFSNRLNMSIRNMFFLPKNMRLAAKQTISRSGQLMVIFTISVIFSFILITLFGFYSSMSDERQAAKIFGQPIGDIVVTLIPDENGDYKYDMEYLTQEIDKLSPIDQFYEMSQGYAEINGSVVRVNSFSDFLLADMPEPISGRYPKYDNEIMITPQIGDLFSLKIGDTLTLQSGKESHKFIITGTISAANDMGKVVFCTTGGMASFNQMGISDGRAFILKDSSDLDNLIDKLNNLYSNNAVIQNLRKQISGVTSGIRLGILGITAVIIFVAMLLIFLTTMLIARIAVGREQADMGMLKACGYSAGQLRTQFSLRFLFISLIGCVAGLALNLAFSDKMLSAVLGLAGISRFVGDKSVFILMVPIILVCGFTMLFAWMSTRRIKRINVQSLAAE